MSKPTLLEAIAKTHGCYVCGTDNAGSYDLTEAVSDMLERIDELETAVSSLRERIDEA